MIEAKFFTVGTYLYKYNLTVLFVSPSKIAHEKFYIYCPPLLLNEIYAHDSERGSKDSHCHGLATKDSQRYSMIIIQCICYYDPCLLTNQ